MKKIMVSLILALVLILVPSCLFAANYVEIYSDSNYLIYLDTSSIQEHETYYQALTKVIYGGEAKIEESKRYKKEVDHIFFLDAYAKATKQKCYLAAYAYDKDENLIASFNDENSPMSWNSIIPDSVADTTIEAVYSYAGN